MKPGCDKYCSARGHYGDCPNKQPKIEEWKAKTVKSCPCQPREHYCDQPKRVVLGEGKAYISSSLEWIATSSPGYFNPITARIHGKKIRLIAEIIE